MKYKSSYNTYYYISVLIIFLIAALFRLSCLTLRPIHADEAVHAIKFGTLLEEGYYRYDKNEYHGPTLNYFTLVPAWLKSQKTLASLDESTLRIVPAVAGLGLILLLLLMTDGFGRKLTMPIAFLTAISPALIFYCRYYIQETLLIFFTFGSIVSIYRFIMTRKTGWLLLTGIFLGLMHATKETSLINFMIMIVAFFSVVFIRFKKIREVKKFLASFRFWNIIIIAGTAIIVSALFYSSFFSNPAGIPDSFRAYQVYFARAGSNELHIHPWYYYLQLLTFSKSPSGMIWSELWILIAACAGFYSLIREKNKNNTQYYLMLFVGLYTIMLILVYSAIPYKTPWSMLGFYHGLIILAGYGIVQLFSLSKKLWSRVLLVLFSLAGSMHLLGQVYLLNFQTPSDPFNPYVYAQTGSDIFKIISRIDSVALASPQGKDLPVEVIFPGHDYWPLPWYLRDYKNVGYRESVDFSQPNAPIILASLKVENEIIRRFYEIPPPGERYLYLPLFENYMELRPMVEVRGYIRKDVWDNYIRFRNKKD